MDKATKLSDVVALEGELSSRQADLESLLAQQASLKDRTSLATITLSLSETPVKKAAKEDADPGFLDALSGGWHVLVTVVRWLALAIGALLPFAAVLAVIVAAWTWVVRPRLSRRPSPAVAPAPVPSPAPAVAPGPAAPTPPAPVPGARPASEPAPGSEGAPPKAAPSHRGGSAEHAEEE
jgi:hypothetical protein